MNTKETLNITFNDSWDTKESLDDLFKETRSQLIIRIWLEIQISTGHPNRNNLLNNSFSNRSSSGSITKNKMIQ